MYGIEKYCMNALPHSLFVLYTSISYIRRNGYDKGTGKSLSLHG